MLRRLQPRAARRYASAALLGCLLLLSAWLAGSARGQETTVPTKPPTATPTPSPADALLAARFAFEGKVGEAIGAYLAVVAEGAPHARLDARLALARIYLDEGIEAAAARQLNAYLLEAPNDADVRRAQFLLAETLSLQGAWLSALPLYDAYIQGQGPAANYARLGRAEALAHLGRAGEAEAEANSVMQLDLPQSRRLAFMLSIARALEAAQPQSALAWYQRLGRSSRAPEDDALALWHGALIKGDLQAKLDAWLTIVQRYPESSTAQAIVDDMPGGDTTIVVFVDDYYRGLVYYRGGRSDDARRAFQASLDFNQTPAGGDRSLAARSAYYLAVLDEAGGNLDAAIDGYARVVQLDAKLDLADDALWWRGKLLERQARAGDARDDYKQLVADHGTSDWAADARFRLGLIDYDAHQFSQAAQEFVAIAGDSKAVEQERALLWQGKSLAALGDHAAADAVWNTLRAHVPDGYYGLRAAVLLGDARGTLKDAGLSSEREPDWTAIEAWLRSIGQDDPSPVLSALLFNPHWALGQELMALGMERRASAEFELLLNAAGRNPTRLYHVARFARAAGLTSVSARAAARLLADVKEQDARGAPLDLWRLAYPAPYASLVRDVSDEQDVPDVLLLAVVRQESFFDPLAGSTAGALGLAQVIPATGQGIADDLGINNFTTDELYRPAVSLRFGAHYLGQQLKVFYGNVYDALAAYNGGPGNAQRWSDISGGDVDRSYEEIEFDQTKAYVRLVSENLARYRQLYQGLAAPALPLD